MRATRTVHVLALTAIVLLAPRWGAAQSPSQRELNGFVIGQHRDVLEGAFGDPYNERKTDDGWVYRTYLLRDEPPAYMTFKFPSDDLDHFISVQIAGDRSTPMMPFAGVSLGAPAADVRRTIGRPSEKRRLADPPVEVWEYENRNYSFEIEAGKGLVSIQIFGYEGFGEPPGWPLPMPWNDVRSRLRSTDAARLVATFAPDAEVYQGTEVFRFDNSVRNVLSDSTSRFRRGLALVVAALQHELAREPAEVNMRVSLGSPVRSVFKFPVGAPVEEIVLTPHAGEWRVWEIKLR